MLFGLVSELHISVVIFFHPIILPVIVFLFQKARSAETVMFPQVLPCDVYRRHSVERARSAIRMPPAPSKLKPDIHVQTIS